MWEEIVVAHEAWRKVIYTCNIDFRPSLLAKDTTPSPTLFCPSEQGWFSAGYKRGKGTSGDVVSACESFGSVSFDHLRDKSMLTTAVSCLDLSCLLNIHNDILRR